MIEPVGRPRHHVVPWTARAYDALPGSPVTIGVGFAGVLFAAYTSFAYAYAVTLESTPAEIDLFDLQAFQPLVRQGLTNAILVIGLAAAASLFMLESGFAAMMVRVWAASVVFGWIGLMLPLRGAMVEFGLDRLLSS